MGRRKPKRTLKRQSPEQALGSEANHLSVVDDVAGLYGHDLPGGNRFKGKHPEAGHRSVADLNLGRTPTADGSHGSGQARAAPR